MDFIKKETEYESRRLTEEKGHFFFGYYDLPAWNLSETYHLCHKVDFFNRLPGEEDKAEIGIIDIRTGKYSPLAVTTAWNFQQGCMLQWNPVDPENEIIFNTRTSEGYKGVVMNVQNGSERRLERPVTNVDPLGRNALSISFDRMFDFRPGYGYAGGKDAYSDAKHPSQDGIFIIDLETGKSSLIISLEHIWELTSNMLEGKDRKIMINHITFNTDGTRFVFLVRYFPEPGDGSWKTAVLTSDTRGTDISILMKYGYASHYNWRDPEHIIFHCGGPEGKQLYLFTDKTEQISTLDTGFFLQDGHCNYSPDRKHLLYDSYPDKDSFRHLYLYDLEQKRGIELGAYHVDTDLPWDIRCDLHPRWNRSGSAVSFDSIHEGMRNIYYMEL
jgi:hypothetical protein